MVQGLRDGLWAVDDEILLGASGSASDDAGSLGEQALDVLAGLAVAAVELLRGAGAVEVKAGALPVSGAADYVVAISVDALGLAAAVGGDEARLLALAGLADAGPKVLLTTKIEKRVIALYIEPVST